MDPRGHIKAMLGGLGKTNRRFFIPEVVQTSEMDCGPAALTCLLKGHGIHASYARVREACQTGLDGSSIDVIENLAIGFGLDAEQVILPAEDVLSTEARALPAIVIVRNPQGFTHFIVLWSQQAGLVQVMDPAVGRRWITPRQLQNWLYLHSLNVQETQWREWACSEEFIACLRRKLFDIQVPRGEAELLITEALADQTWRSLAGLSACVHMAKASSGVLDRCHRLDFVKSLFEQIARANLSWDATKAKDSWRTIPGRYWPVLPAPPGLDGTAQLLIRGAVLVRINGPRDDRDIGDSVAPSLGQEGNLFAPEPASLGDVPIATANENPRRPLGELFRLVREDGLFNISVLFKSLALSAGAVFIQAILFRSFLDISRDLDRPGQRLAAMGILLAFLLATLALNFPIASEVLRIGRRLEARLRIAILQKLARQDDRYLRSRLISDMAERSHSVALVRQLPNLGVQLLGSAFQLIITAAGIIWLSPKTAAIVLISAAASIMLPMLCQPLLAERSLRVRSHLGALSRFYLDALLGLVPIRAHAAERAIRYMHERRLLDWSRAGLRLLRLVVFLNGLQFVVGFGLAIWLVSSHVTASNNPGTLLLLVFWVLSIPTLGGAIAGSICGYVNYRSVMLRLLEPLSAPDTNVSETKEFHSVETALIKNSVDLPNSAAGIQIDFQNASVSIGDNPILTDLNLAIDPGSHVAILGPSGAGKSSLVGSLLGWFRVSNGMILVDGHQLDPERLEKLREATAWIDPNVQLWNRSLEFNLRYGTGFTSLADFGRVIEVAELRDLLENLPDGLQSVLGESGSLVSGGEGQRVRLGRAMLRRNVRLVVLDEPFAALDKDRRRRLIKGMRSLWHQATILYITHDVEEALAFDRVLVMAAGKVVEDGIAHNLFANIESRYHAMYEADHSIRDQFMSSEYWRHLKIIAGRLVEDTGHRRADEAGRKVASKSRPPLLARNFGTKT